MIAPKRTALNEISPPFKVYKAPTRKKVKILLLSLISFFLLLGLLSLHKRTLHIDEPVLAEQVYWLLKEGVVKSVLYTGFGTGLENNLLVYHKLFIWISAGISPFFGTSLTVLRLLPLLCSIGLCLLLYRYCTRYVAIVSGNGKLIFNISLLLLLSNFLFVQFSFLYRPELMQALFGFGSYYLLYSYLQKQEKKCVVGSGALAGLSLLTHLNGFIFIGAGFLLLLSRKKWKDSYFFLLPAILVSSLYLIDMMAPGELQQFLIQFSGAPAFKPSDLDPFYRIGRILNEHKRYFHSPLEGSFTILFIIVVFFNWKQLWKKHSTLILYLLFGGFCLAVVNQGYTNKYALPLLPYAVLLMAISFNSLLLEQRVKVLKVIAVCSFIYAGIQLFYLHDLFSKKVDITARNAEISSHLLPEAEGSRILATATFFFNEGKKFDMICTASYRAQTSRFNRLGINKPDFFKHTKSLDCQYVVLDLLFQNYSIHDIFSPEDLKPGKTHYGYKVIQSKNNYVIMERL